MPRAQIAALAVILLAGEARACTLCHSAQAISIRHRLLAPDLWWNIAAVLMPLILLLAVIAWTAAEHDGSRT